MLSLIHICFEDAQGDVVITMDADLQDSPDEIPELYRMIMEEDYDLISGWKKKRYDPITKTLPTKLFNATARKFSGIKLHDFNCGLKAYKNTVVKNIEVYGEMHRYIPVSYTHLDCDNGEINPNVVEKYYLCHHIQLMTKELDKEYRRLLLSQRIDSGSLNYDLLRQHIEVFSRSDVLRSQAVTIYDNFRFEHAYVSAVSYTHLIRTGSLALLTFFLGIVQMLLGSYTKVQKITHIQ